MMKRVFLKEETFLFSPDGSGILFLFAKRKRYSGQRVEFSEKT